jgi:hypothetical protein
MPASRDPRPPMMQTGSKPDPDPTVLTTQQLLREIGTSRETTEAILTGVKTAIEARLDAMDVAIKLVHEQTEKFGGLIEASVNQLKDIDQVKFDAIRDRFSDAKSALDVALQSASKAVDAAFSAAKEAASKIEVSFTKAIEQLQTLTIAQQKATDDKIDDARTRITTLESQKRGSSDSMVFIVSVAGLAIALIAAVAAVGALMRH